MKEDLQKLFELIHRRDARKMNVEVPGSPEDDKHENDTAEGREQQEADQNEQRDSHEKNRVKEEDGNARKSRGSEGQ